VGTAVLDPFDSARRIVADRCRPRPVPWRVPAPPKVAPGVSLRPWPAAPVQPGQRLTPRASEVESRNPSDEKRGETMIADATRKTEVRRGRALGFKTTDSRGDCGALMFRAIGASFRRKPRREPEPSRRPAAAQPFGDRARDSVPLRRRIPRKGGMGRVTMLPGAVRPDVLSQLEPLRRQHGADIAEGDGWVARPDTLDRNLPFAKPCDVKFSRPQSRSERSATPFGTRFPRTFSRMRGTLEPSVRCSATGASAIHSDRRRHDHDPRPRPEPLPRERSDLARSPSRERRADTRHISRRQRRSVSHD
jgi:hypothetical protein